MPSRPTNSHARRTGSQPPAGPNAPEPTIPGAVEDPTAQMLYQRLVLEADRAWPSIVEPTGAVIGFDPVALGEMFLMRDVWNRCGRDFAPDGYDFAMRHNGMPVGGSYEPHVRKALDRLREELRFDLNERVAFDIVGIVEGPGTIRERIEPPAGEAAQWCTVDCVRLRIIAVHAGPLAVGPPVPVRRGA
jgi:hypothetical protein